MAVKNTIKRWVEQGKEGLGIASDYAYGKYKKTKGTGLSILKRLQWKDFDVESAVKGLKELKSKEGFNKLPIEHQSKLIEDYMRNLK